MPIIPPGTVSLEEGRNDKFGEKTLGPPHFRRIKTKNCFYRFSPAEMCPSRCSGQTHGDRHSFKNIQVHTRILFFHSSIQYDRNELHKLTLYIRQIRFNQLTTQVMFSL